MFPPVNLFKHLDLKAYLIKIFLRYLILRTSGSVSKIFLDKKNAEIRQKL